MEIEIERVLGLPAHPLFAHAPVVLIPLTVAGAGGCVVSRRWRERIGWAVVASAALVVVSVQLSIGSGKALQESVRKSDLVRDHAGMADTLLPLSITFLLAVAALMAADRAYRRRAAPEAGGVPAPGHRRAVLSALGVLTLATGALCGVWIFRVGHSGARAVWDDPARPLLVR